MQEEKTPITIPSESKPSEEKSQTVTTSTPHVASAPNTDPRGNPISNSEEKPSTTPCLCETCCNKVSEKIDKGLCLTIQSGITAGSGYAGWECGKYFLASLGEFIAECCGIKCCASTACTICGCPTTGAILTTSLTVATLAAYRRDRESCRTLSGFREALVNTRQCITRCVTDCCTRDINNGNYQRLERQ